MECSAIPAKVIASCFALIGFVAAMVVGWAVDNPTVTIIWRALVCMGVCYAVGRVFGGVAAHAVQIEIDAHKKKYPLPPRGGEAVTMPSVDAASHAPAKDDGTLEAA